MNDVVKVPAILEGINTLKDRTLKVTFHTNEISAETGASLMRLNQNFGWLLFASEGVSEIEIPSEPPKEFRNEKSQSQRLRAVLFLWWQQDGSKGEFESFYRQKMETIINWVKDKLEE